MNERADRVFAGQQRQASPLAPVDMLSRRDLVRLLAGLAAVPRLAPLGAQPLPPEAAATPASEPAPRLPTAVFAQRPLIQDVVLSPDGLHIAGLVNLDDTTVLVTRAVAGDGTIKSLLKTDNQGFHFGWLAWVGPDRLLTSVRYRGLRGFTGVTETRLMSIHRDGSGTRVLNQQTDNRGGLLPGRSVQLQDRVVDLLPEDGSHVLLAVASATSPGSPSVYKVEVATGERTLVHGGQRGIVDWMTDAEHRVRIGIGRDDNTIKVIERPVGGDWRTLWTFALRGDAECWPLGFGRNPNELWVTGWHEGHRAVFSVDLADPALPRTLRLARPGRDIEARLMRSRRSGEVVGLRMNMVAGVDGTRAEIWDADLRALVQAVDQQLPGRFNRLLGFDREENRYLLYSSGNGLPGRYFIGDRSQGALAVLSETQRGLLPQHLAGKRMVRISARDGLAMNAFLTRPRGAAERTPLPMVLLAHGGPQGRDDADFDPWTELLANRGYMVLQVNFRGSTGSGLAYQLARLQRWGLEMQDDLTDAVEWAVAQQLADPQRVAIVGGSYGGYAALMGVVKTPKLYRCAISYAGIGDLQDLISHQSQFLGGAASAELQIGKFWGDRERLRATSPALQAERIEAPVLLAHGTADTVVPVEQSRDMAKALARAGKAHRYIEQDGGDHNLSRYSHRLEFFGAMEGFLAQHLA